MPARERVPAVLKPSTMTKLAAIGAIACCSFFAFNAQARTSVNSGGGTQTGTAAMNLPTISKVQGLRSGDFVLKPSVQVAGHHDTNVFNGHEDDRGNPPVAGTSIRIEPVLNLTNGASSEIQFSFNAKGDVRLYLSDNPALDNLTNFGGTADLGVTFAARRAISFTLFDHFTRALQADNWESLNTLNRVANDVGGRVSFHPGEIPERRPFEVSLMGSYATDRFDLFTAGNTNTIRTRLTSSWRFLPKTAVVLDSTWDFRNFDNPNALSLTSNSKPWRVNLGLAGAVTKRVTARVTGGYGMSLHEKGAAFSGGLWGIGIGYRASASTVVHLNYNHDFRDAFMGNFVDYHRVGGDLNQRFGTMLDVTVYGYLTYGVFGALDGSNLPAGTKINTSERVDINVDTGVKAHFEVSRMVGALLSYRLRGVFTNFQVSTQSDELLDVGSYTAHELLAAVSLRY